MRDPDIGEYRISFILPVFKSDTAQVFSRSLQSCLDQTYAAMEVILLIDGTTTQECRDLASEYESRFPGRIRELLFPEYTPVGDCLAEGIKEARGEWIAMMEADDINDSNRLKHQTDYLTANPDTDIVGTWLHESGNIFDKPEVLRVVPLEEGKIKQYARFRSPFNNQTILFRRDMALQVGYADCFRNQDWYFALRLLKQGYKPGNIPLALVHAQTDNYRRRAGYRVFKNDLAAIRLFHKENLIPHWVFLCSVCLKFGARLIPPAAVQFLYSSFLRKKI